MWRREDSGAWLFDLWPRSAGDHDRIDRLTIWPEPGGSEGSPQWLGAVLIGGRVQCRTCSRATPEEAMAAVVGQFRALLDAWEIALAEAGP